LLAIRALLWERAMLAKSFRTAAPDKSFADTPRVHPCRLFSGIPAAGGPQKHVRRRRCCMVHTAEPATRRLVNAVTAGGDRVGGNREQGSLLRVEKQ
jgi:hypothetical protein